MLPDFVCSILSQLFGAIATAFPFLESPLGDVFARLCGEQEA